MGDWTYNNIRIYVQKLDVSAEQIISRLNPLGGGTVLHFFGYDEPITKISCYVVGWTNLSSILGTLTTASGYNLDSPAGYAGTFYTKNIKYELTKNTWQTLDQTQDCTTPVYNVELELYV